MLRTAEQTRVLKNFDLPIDVAGGDQHYLVCTLTLHMECAEVEVSNPVRGQMSEGDGWRDATPDEVAKLFELAKSIDQEELLGWFE